MTRIYFLIFATFIFLAAAASYSQVNDGSGTGMKMGRGRHGNSNKQSAPAKLSHGKLVGHCTMLVGGGNLIDGPCLNILLILKDANDNELARTRTDGKGEFDFEAAQGGQYKIASGTRLIEVVSPTELLNSGVRVDLKLRQK